VFAQLPAPQGVPLAHSFTSTHVAINPDPDVEKPAPQPQLYPPVVLVQVFVAERLRPHAVAARHSLTSTHVVPLNEYPPGHPHV